MTTSTIGTVRTLVESVLGAVEEAEARYRLRTALQLLDVVEEHAAHTRIALESADLEPELVEQLSELGYLD